MALTPAELFGRCISFCLSCSTCSHPAPAMLTCARPHGTRSHASGCASPSVLCASSFCAAARRRPTPLMPGTLAAAPACIWWHARPALSLRRPHVWCGACMVRRMYGAARPALSLRRPHVWWHARPALSLRRPHVWWHASSLGRPPLQAFDGSRNCAHPTGRRLLPAGTSCTPLLLWVGAPCVPHPLRHNVGYGGNACTAVGQHALRDGAHSWIAPIVSG